MASVPAGQYRPTNRQNFDPEEQALVRSLAHRNPIPVLPPNHLYTSCASSPTAISRRQDITRSCLAPRAVTALAIQGNRSPLPITREGLAIGSLLGHTSRNI